MARKKIQLEEEKKKSKSKLEAKTKKTKGSAKTSKKRKKLKSEPIEDSSIVIVDDDLKIDKEKELEERRAYLEEARSQDASD